MYALENIDFSDRLGKANFLKNPTNNLAKAESFYKSEHKG
jgi:hypothetical protein